MNRKTVEYLLRIRNINPILHGLFGGRERMGGAESAHPLQNVSKAYLS